MFARGNTCLRGCRYGYLQHISSEAEAKITSKTEAIIIVHYAGLCADIVGFRRLAQKHGLLLIEDSAEALGAEIDGVQAGSGGNGCFSFYPTKNITTCEGGMLTLNSEGEYDKSEGACSAWCI